MIVECKIMPSPPQITKHEFGQFQQFIFELAGITLPASKQALVSGRLAKRLIFYELNSYGEYFKLLNNKLMSDEVQTAVDLLTTNETYFFILISCANKQWRHGGVIKFSGFGVLPVLVGKRLTVLL